MALPPNQDPFTLANAGREYPVRVADHGKIIFLGNASDGRVGTFTIEFVPDASWSGTFAVLGRVYGKPASDNGVGFSPIPYRRICLNNVASDRAIVSDVLTGHFIIEVPASGLAIGLLASVQASGGVVYNWPLNGPSGL